MVTIAKFVAFPQFLLTNSFECLQIKRIKNCTAITNIDSNAQYLKQFTVAFNSILGFLESNFHIKLFECGSTIPRYKC